MFLDAGIDIGEGADRAGNRAGGDIGARCQQPRLVAREFGIGLGQLDPNVTGSAWMPWLRPIVGVSLCSKARRFSTLEQLVDVGKQDVDGARKLHREAGVEHVGRGHALVDEARVGPRISARWSGRRSRHAW
jgi:hypothetical protein